MVALRYKNEFVDRIYGGQLAGVLLDKTCFYAEQGGQIYDNGFITKTGDEVSAQDYFQETICHYFSFNFL